MGGGGLGGKGSGGGGDGGGGGGGDPVQPEALTDTAPTGGCCVSLLPQPRRDSGVYSQPALQSPGQVEQAYWLATAQKVPNSGSVKPPDCGQYQLLGSWYALGCVVDTVAASFLALQAALSPLM